MKLNKYGLSGNTQDELIRSFYSQQEIKLTSLSFEGSVNEKKSNVDDPIESHQRYYSDGSLRNVNTINVQYPPIPLPSSLSYPTPPVLIRNLSLWIKQNS
jgi:hypothetical protein